MKNVFTPTKKPRVDQPSDTESENDYSEKEKGENGSEKEDYTRYW